MQTKLTSQTITPILYTHYGDNWIRGSERALLDLLSHIDRDVYQPIVWTNCQALRTELDSLNIPSYFSSFPILFGWLKPHFDVFHYYRLIKNGLHIIKKHKILLLHSNSAAPCQWLNLIARIAHLPLVLHSHSFYPFRDRLTLGMHQLKTIVTVSKSVAQQLTDDGIDEHKLHVIYNGINTSFIDHQKVINIRSHYGLTQKDFIITTVGSLIKRKGIDLIIRSLMPLIKKNYPLHLMVIGSGPEHSRLNKLIKSNGLSKNIHLLGNKSDVACYLKSSDLYVSAAKEEAFGLSVAEASYCKLPIIATKTGGIKEVVLHGRTGLLVPIDSCHDLTNSILNLYQSPSLRQLMGEMGHEHISKSFSLEQNTKMFHHLYQKILTDPNMKLRWFNDFIIMLPFKRFILILVKIIYRSIHNEKKKKTSGY